MRIALVGSVALFLAAALGAEASTSAARYSVTLNGTIVDFVSYDRTSQAGEDCRVRRIGSGRRSLVVAMVSPARVTVTGIGKRVVFRPSRLAVRLTGTAGQGRYEETR